MPILKASSILRKMKLLGGFLPPRVLGIVIEWTALHQLELMDNWVRARNQESLNDIAKMVPPPIATFLLTSETNSYI